MSSHNDHLGNGSLTRPVQEPQWVTDLAYSDFRDGTYDADLNNDGTDDLVDPSGERPDGWDFEDVLAYNQLNWHWKMVGAWLIYHDSKVTGEYVDIGIFQDASSKDVIAGIVAAGTEGSTTGDAVWRTEVIETVTLREGGSTNGVAESFAFRDDTGNLGDAALSQIRINGSSKSGDDRIVTENDLLRIFNSSGVLAPIEASKVLTQALETSSDMIEVIDSTSSVGTSGVAEMLINAITLSTLQNDEDRNGSSTSYIDLRDTVNASSDEGSAGIRGEYWLERQNNPGVAALDLRSPIAPQTRGSGGLQAAYWVGDSGGSGVDLDVRSRSSPGTPESGRVGANSVRTDELRPLSTEDVQDGGAASQIETVSQPQTSSPNRGQIDARNVPVAHGVFQIDDLDTDAAFLDNGVNINGVNRTGTGVYVVTLTTPYPSEQTAGSQNDLGQPINVCPNAQLRQPVGVFVSARPLGLNGNNRMEIEIVFHDSTGSGVDPASKNAGQVEFDLFVYSPRLEKA
ncbi:MAG: hypothetical protein ABEN55_19705 [Bradymonadaceae bacterium]